MSRCVGTCIGIDADLLFATRQIERQIFGARSAETSVSDGSIRADQSVQDRSFEALDRTVAACWSALNCIADAQGQSAVQPSGCFIALS